jgi:predicted secreted protein
MRNLILSSALTLTLLAVGCVSPAAVSALKRGIAANKGHMADESLPQEAREIATDNYDLDNQILYNLCGDEMPEDTKARMKAREDAKAADDAETEREDANGGGE